MSNLFEYFVKSAAGYKPDAAVRRGSYARLEAQSPGGIIRSSTIGHQGLSKRTAAQLRKTHNLPMPGQQPTGPDAATSRGSMAQGGQRRPSVPVNPSPAPGTATPPAQPATVAGAPQTNPRQAATGTGAPPYRPGSLAKTFAPHIPGIANLSNKDIRSAYVKGAYWDSHRGLGTELDKSIQGHADWQLYNKLNQLGLNMHGDNSAQASGVTTALQHLDALRYRDDAANYDPLARAGVDTQGVSANATPEELALRQRPFDPSKIRRV